MQLTLNILNMIIRKKEMILNKKILITGATSGIGLEIKKKLSLNNVVDNFSFSNGYDLSTKEGLNKILKLVKQYDYIFLNAGIFFKGNSNTIDDEYMDKIFQVNALSNIKIINFLYNEIANQNIKIIVTLSTTIGINGAYQSIYNISKKMLNEYIISINTEFINQNKKGKIFRFIPHYISGTRMTGNHQEIDSNIFNIIDALILSIENEEDFYLPKKDLYLKIFNNYFIDPYKQGIDSIKYKKERG